MYSIEEFAEKTASIITEKLGRSCKVKTLALEKINTGKLYSIVIVNGKYNASPNFYLGGFYSSYTTGEYTVPETAESIIKEYNKMKDFIKDGSTLVADLSEEEWVKERLFLVLINKDKNKNFLNDAVYSDHAGLALVLYILVEDGINGMAKVKVTKNMCQDFRWNEKDIASYALGNTARLLPLELCPLERLIARLLNVEGKDIQPADGNIPACKEGWTVLSNQTGLYGQCH